ncbi:LysE family transporter [Pseudodesulfovibrio sp. JC047]|uniref:LysE family translocator n=1 Tax=Pseudodesulfovibrio sp. JC047 TaxID=2683199 RepID=UPI0013CF88D8|nr:LysE family translocator [Pseudodesulfovibrio sp. JC047]NDV18401.1 LysE family transporter [Pseudodesulfovibrio sp. JC047]
MLGILLYSIGVMYTPGPVNILSLNRGMHTRFTTHISFCMGVGTALCFWFLLVGYAGSAVIDHSVMPIISALGTAFILFLAYKIIASESALERDEHTGSAFSFRDGLLMQLLNPKSFLVVLPVTAVQFPAAGIQGSAIALWSIGLGLLGFGAPLVYAVAGTKVSRYIENSLYLKWFNYCMGAVLVFVALEMAYTHIYRAVW